MFAFFIFIILVGLLVLTHELGHFASAKLFGVRVEEFGIGFPPSIISVQYGETSYSLNWLPFGGFVRLEGEDNLSDTAGSFGASSHWKKAIILLSGVGMNLLIAWLLLSIVLMNGVEVPADIAGPDAILSQRSVVIVDVLAHSPAQQAGLVTGDDIIRIDNQPITQSSDLKGYLHKSQQKQIVLTITRQQAVMTVTVRPAYMSDLNMWGIGVGLDDVALIHYPFILAIGKGALWTGSMTKQIVFAFGHLVSSTIKTHALDSSQVTGPIGIATIAGHIAHQGIIPFFQFAAMLSINLAILNILPIPALDGGRFLVVAIEGISRRPVNKYWEGMVHRVGFILLIILIVIVTYHDIVHFSTSVLNR